jgi:hypothetical protein
VLSSSAARRITERARRLGLDPVVPFSPSWLAEDSVEARALARLGGRDVLGLLFTSSRALWTPFVSAFQSEPDLQRDPDPLDRYVERAVRESLDELAHESTVAFAHAIRPEGAFPIQRLADAIGFAALSPSHLSVHPELGPWISLRAVALLAAPCSTAPRPVQRSACRGCPAPCVAALEHAVRVSAGETGRDVVTRHAEAWIAVRDACPVGRDARYPAAQIDFHYRRRLPL